MFYDYQCPDCGHKFEKNVPITNASEPQKCPKCDKYAYKLLSHKFNIAARNWRNSDELKISRRYNRETEDANVDK